MCRDKSHSGRRCPGQTSRPHRRAATALLSQEAGLAPAVSAQIYRAVATDVARTITSGITASREVVTRITQQIKEHIMTSNTLTDAQKRNLSDRITRRMSADDMSTRQVGIWSRVLDALRKIRTAGVAIGVTAVLAACGGGEEPTDYVTPTVAPSTSSSAPVEETPAGEAPVAATDAPMGIDPSSVDLPGETPWSADQMSTALSETMTTVETAQGLVAVQRAHDAADARLYEPLRQRLTTNAFESLEMDVRTNGDDAVSADALVARTFADGTVVHPETGQRIEVDHVEPAYNTPNYLVESGAQGDYQGNVEESRLVQQGTVDSTYVGSDVETGAPAEVTFSKSYRFSYLPSADGGWDLDGWYADTRLGG